MPETADPSQSHEPLDLIPTEIHASLAVRLSRACSARTDDDSVSRGYIERVRRIHVVEIPTARAETMSSVSGVGGRLDLEPVRMRADVVDYCPSLRSSLAAAKKPMRLQDLVRAFELRVLTPQPGDFLAPRLGVRRGRGGALAVLAAESSPQRVGVHSDEFTDLAASYGLREPTLGDTILVQADHAGAGFAVVLARCLHESISVADHALRQLQADSKHHPSGIWHHPTRHRALPWTPQERHHHPLDRPIHQDRLLAIRS